MASDIDGAVRVAHIAREFNWTWDAEDVARFCSEAGWGLGELFPSGGVVVTDLNVGRPVAFVQLDDGAAPELLFDKPGLVDVSVVISDISEGGGVSLRSTTDLFVENYECLVPELAIPAGFEPGENLRIRWNLSRVVVFLEAYETHLVLRLVNPAAQELIDVVAEDADDTHSGSFKHHGVFESRDWNELSEQLTESISRMPTGGILTVRGSGGRFARFMLCEDDSGLDRSTISISPRFFCDISGNGDMYPMYHMSTPDHLALMRNGWTKPDRKRRNSWHRCVDWPARYSDVRALVDSAIAAMRSSLKFDRASEVHLETIDVAWLS